MHRAALALALVAGLGGVVGGVVVVAKRAVGVEGHLGVEQHDIARGGHDEGVDLDQVGVGVHVGAVQGHQHIGHRAGDGLGNTGGLHPLAAGLF